VGAEVGVGDGDLHDQILQLEAEMEKLAERIDRCRKIVLGSKIAIAAASILLLAVTVGLIRSDPVYIVGAIAVVIGGIVAFGSNASTLNQTAISLKAAGARRTELIDRANPRVIGEADGVDRRYTFRS